MAFTAPGSQHSRQSRRGSATCASSRPTSNSRRWATPSLTRGRSAIEARPSHGFDAYRVNGTPADCVALGVHIWGQVDVVLSGINFGPNIGNGMWHSGTLAAAKQAASARRIRGIALSTPTSGDEPNFDVLEPHVERVLRVAAVGVSAAACQRELPARTSRDPLDPPGRGALRRPRRFPQPTPWAARSTG